MVLQIFRQKPATSTSKNTNKSNTVGGSPTASHFSCFAKISNQKKAIPGLPPLRGSLDFSSTSGAAELARSAAQPRAQTVLAQLHRLLMKNRGGAQGKVNQSPKQKKPCAHSAHQTKKQGKRVGAAHTRSSILKPLLNLQLLLIYPPIIRH